ncbi:MAG TPA: lantibiotic dehydratase C-terminal domain-containing protein [Pyrinomonadaceae bacterium]|nr:lantibiotic dehydratase C-terminal domain-containing protein [Pyrinomonadaceae bacterium]
MLNFQRGWQSYHLFYHDNLDTPLLKCVEPLVRTLHQLGWLKKFFFVRYQLGGPHLRLRILPTPNCEEQTREMIRREVEKFLKHYPSLNTKNETQIRRANKVILEHDSHEDGDEVYPNNSLLEAPFVPETERYGGARLLPHSLDFFVVSTVAALLSLKQNSARGRTTDMGSTARYQIRLAIGFSNSFEELDELLSYGMRWGSLFNPNFELLTRKLYEQQKPKINRLLVDELAIASTRASISSAITTAGLWTNAAASLAVSLAETDDTSRRHILESHLHMSANRFGLNNADEFYLSGLLYYALKELADTDRIEIDRYLSTRPRSTDGLATSLDDVIGLLAAESLPATSSHCA